jgi:hypothetical protein
VAAGSARQARLEKLRWYSVGYGQHRQAWYGLTENC